MRTPPRCMLGYIVLHCCCDWEGTHAVNLSRTALICNNKKKRDVSYSTQFPSLPLNERIYALIGMQPAFIVNLLPFRAPANKLEQEWQTKIAASPLHCGCDNFAMRQAFNRLCHKVSGFSSFFFSRKNSLNIILLPYKKVSSSKTFRVMYTF